jgi:Domain of unknown function DUF1828/Domain of unknown function DUF1829
MTTIANIESYYKFLNDRTKVEQLSNVATAFYLPFLDHNSDFIQIYIQKEITNRYLITDDGYYIQDLVINGFDIKNGVKNQKLKEVLKEFKIEVDSDDCLYVMADDESVNSKIHDLLQAIIKIVDITYLAKPVVLKAFQEYVFAVFDEMNLAYSKNIKKESKTGINYTFDAIINKTKNSKEKLVCCFQNPDLDKLRLGLLQYYEIAPTVPDTEFIYILEDKSDIRSSTGTDLLVSSFLANGITVINSKNLPKEAIKLIVI